jgi:hypothetical protein
MARDLVSGAVLVAGAGTIVAVVRRAGGLDGIGLPQALALLSIAVGMALLALDLALARRRRERPLPEAPGAPSVPARGTALFASGVSLALGGVTYAWTGVLWFAFLVFAPPFAFRRGRGRS